MTWGPFAFDVALTYAALATCIWPPCESRPANAVIGRGAFFAFVLSAAATLILRDAVVFHEALAAASLIVPLWLRPRWGLVLVATLVGRAVGFDFASTTLVFAPAVAGWTVSVLMERNWWPRFRRLLYSLGLLGTAGGLIPQAIVRAWGGDGAVVPWSARIIGGSLLSVSVLLFVIAEKNLCRFGGTADPFEPPTELVVDGVYAQVRNPLQIAQSMFVAGAAVLTGQWVSGVYAVCFVGALLGPMRLWEERRLVARFGEPYLTYQRRVPAFLPKWGEQRATRPPISRRL